MKKSIVFTLLVLLSFISVTLAQIDDGWSEAGNAAYNSSLRSIAFTTDLKGYAVGSGGSFLKTGDGGLTWIAYNTGFNFIFNRIIFLDEATGYLVGNVNQNEGGRLLKTTDGGNTWTLLYSDAVRFHNIFFNQTGMACIVAYERFYKSTDGGLTWPFVKINGTYDIYSVYFKNANEGFIAANGGGFKTSDGGMTWAEFQDGTYNDVVFTDNNNGFMSSNSQYTVLKTTNGGTSWSETSSTNIGFCNNIYFKNSQTGFAWSNQNTVPGKIARTTNGGTTWTLITIPTKNAMMDMTEKPNGELFMSGGGGNILKSTNGTSWTIASEGLFKGMLHDMCFAANNTIFACGENGTIVKSTDNASSWSRLNSGTSERLWGICSTPSNNLFAFGDNKTVLKSINSGTTWTVSNTGFDETEANQGEIKFLNDNIGFIAFDAVYKTTDGGKTWKKVLDTLNSWSIDPINDQVIYASGLWGVFKSTDGGNKWQNIDKQSSVFWGFDFLDAENGLAAYQNSFSHLTKDGGTTWQKKYISGFELRDAAMVNTQTMYVVGKNGAVAKTVDATENWNMVNSNTPRHLFDIFFGPDGTGYILGEDGMILRKPFVQTYDLTFDVKDKNGTPVNNAILTLNGFTYPAGTYVIKGLIPGNYEYKISGAGYCDVEGFIVLISNYTENVILDNCFNLLFTVTNIFDDPIEGAEIEFGDSKIMTNNSGIAKMNFKGGININYKISAPGFISITGKTNVTKDTNYVFKLHTDLKAPVALMASDITHNSFKANWKNPENFVKVLLYVSEDNFATYLEGYNGYESKDTNALITGLKQETTYSYKLKAINDDGESGFSNVITLTTSTNSINDLQRPLILSIFPIPAGNSININFFEANKSEISITDMQGKIRISGKVDMTDRWQQDISILNPGIYLIKINNNGAVYTYKFVKI
ncbi:MAG: T9SS type A sorting domain-containing protein [Saprospiraceae bacterium]|nr:T9SS type A sorting domain-containing protein [Saprospiraceae bacterium]